jgi:hypothetical protein
MSARSVSSHVVSRFVRAGTSRPVQSFHFGRIASRLIVFRQACHVRNVVSFRVQLWLARHVAPGVLRHFIAPHVLAGTHMAWRGRLVVPRQFVSWMFAVGASAPVRAGVSCPVPSSQPLALRVVAGLSRRVGSVQCASHLGIAGRSRQGSHLPSRLGRLSSVVALRQFISRVSCPGRLRKSRLVRSPLLTTWQSGLALRRPYSKNGEPVWIA